MKLTGRFVNPPPDIQPIIDANEPVDVESHKGCIKVGETTHIDFEGWQFIGYAMQEAPECGLP